MTYLNEKTIKTANPSEIVAMIRDKLSISENSRYIKNHHNRCSFSQTREGLAFNFSGYDGNKADNCASHNLYILELFSGLGIYSYHDALTLTSWKGCIDIITIYNGEVKDFIELGGYTTTDIIYEILKLTTLSGGSVKRRI